MMKRITAYLLMALSFSAVSAQDMPGFNISNYAGISGIFIQPASIADSRYKFDMNLATVGFQAGNNYISVERKWKGDQEVFISDNNRNKSAYISTNVIGPSFMLTLNKKNAISFTSRGRWMFNVDNVTPQMAELAYNGFNVPDLFGLRLNNDKFSLNTLAWAEFGAGYARVISDKGKHFFKAGGQAKVITGVLSGYFHARTLNYEWTNQYTLNITDSRFGYGLSDNFNIQPEDFDPDDPAKIIRNITSFRTKPSIGFDVGVVYEYRPHPEDYVYEMDGKTDRIRRDLNKYKFRIGASLVDMGRIKFTKAPFSGDFQANVGKWDTRQIILNSIDSNGNFRNPIESFSDTLKKRFTFENTAEDFNIGLPTAFSLQFDYKIWKNLYANLTTYMSPRVISDESKVHALSYYSLSARWDAKWYGLYIPVTITKFNTHLGAAVRLGPLVAGTSDIGNYLFRDKVNAIDVYAGLKIPIPYGKRRTRDKDKDLVSNMKDRCNKQPGTWENRGCPDKDGDGIVDKKDDCPEIAGTKKNKGCPEGEPVIVEADTVEVIEEPVDTVVTAEDTVISAKTYQVLSAIQHETGKFTLTPESGAAIDELAEAMKAYPDWKVRIDGHTDDIGTDEDNLELSRKRAYSVKDELIKRGIKANRISVEYYGESRPIAPNTTEEGRKANRRVEIHIIK